MAAEIQEQQILQEVLGLIRTKLPEGWSLTELPSQSRGIQADAVLRLKSPDGVEARILTEVKTRVYSAAQALTQVTRNLLSDSYPLVVSRFISPAARRQFSAMGLNYADITGNIRLAVAAPGLFIETVGADTDPTPRTVRRSLKGAESSRIVRALTDWRPPFRLFEIAARAKADEALVSRLLQLVQEEGLLTREPRGPVTDVNWEELIRRWAQDYRVTKSNAAEYMLEPRGVPALLAKLADTKLRYALTGSVGASMRAAVAPAVLAMLYVNDRRAATEEFNLRPVQSGGNVVLLVPRDSLPFEGTTRLKDLVIAAPSQVVADLLTGPGRSSSEAEALIDWMKENESAWRR